MVKGRKVLAALSALAATALTGGVAAAVSTQQSAAAPARFTMVRSAATAGAKCIPRAAAYFTVANVRGVQVLRLWASGLPANTTFVVWLNQVPNSPFGVSWYLGDADTNAAGKLNETFIGRFNVESFAVAPGTAPAPQTHRGGMFPDAKNNPTFAPVHLYHVGLWFDSTADARKAKCPGAQTPFNGDHTAGVQAMSTRNFPGQAGPLSRVKVVP